MYIPQMLAHNYFNVLFVLQLIEKQDKIIDILSMFATNRLQSTSASPDNRFTSLTQDSSADGLPLPMTSDTNLSPALPFHPLASSTGSGQSDSLMCHSQQAPPSCHTVPPSNSARSIQDGSPIQAVPPSHLPLASPAGHSSISVFRSPSNRSISSVFKPPSGQMVDPLPDQSLTPNRPSSQMPSQVFQEQVLSSGEVLFTEQDSEHQVQILLPKQHSGQSDYASERSNSTFPEDFNFGWTEEDSDYLTSHSDDLCSPGWYGPTLSTRCHSRDASCSGNETITSPSPQTSIGSSRTRSVTPLPQMSPHNIPPPPFSTPPKLKTVEQVMSRYSGSDLASLRKLTTALAREAIFGRDVLAQKSLSGRKETEQLDKEKLDYIKTLVHSRVPNKSAVDFEDTWKWCRGSLSKSCQTLRNAKTKNIKF